MTLSQEERLVIIDTDAGIDDAIAILMSIQAHRNPKIPFRIVGITSVAGNTGVENVSQNVTRILETMNETTISIFQGISHPMVDPFEMKARHHGEDGFGDVFPKIKPKLESEHAVNAIIRLVHQYPGKITILALGPLTNLAMAIRMDSSITDLVKDIYLMGGNMEGAGNVRVCAEFNFVFDPEAAYVTLSTFKCPIFILPMELGRDRVGLPLEWRNNDLGSMKTTESDLINKIEASCLANRFTGFGNWHSYDSTAVVALITPKSITKMVNHYCTVELHGTHTRGQLVIDYRPHLHPPGNVFIVTDMDTALFQKMIKWAFGGPCPI